MIFYLFSFFLFFFFFSSRRRHTRFSRDWSSDVCSSDLHDEVIALDINPLPFLVTQQLRRGKTLELWELPGQPRKSTWAAVQRTIHPPGPSPANLQLIFADALQPPFAAASFDTIVTPWFIDQVPQNISTFLPTLTALLKPGGSWLNQGPLIYDPAR